MQLLGTPLPGECQYEANRNSEIVAVAKWVFPHTPTPPPAAAAQLGMPEGVNEAPAGAFYGELLKKREKWVIKWEDMYRESLTRPI
jgi:hypothetical protein